ncbi:aldo/keto reductase [Streptomyces caelestis]|uniref:aldo/keto reductase n=1 Tax=Streptomyces caelestis TaxID=36816 RepID=UPI00380AE08D
MAQNTTNLPQRTLGGQGLKAGTIGLGTMGMTMAYGASDDRSSIATITRAHELGVTLFDTAELYGLGIGSNEQLLGRAVKTFRDDILIATRFGFDLTDPTRIGAALDSRPERIREVTENSLRHLDTDHIDVLYQHRVDPDVPIEDVAGTVGELIAEGKVRYFGLSEAGPDTIRRAHAVHPVSVLQTEYSVFERAVEADVLPVVRELGIGFVAYSPLGRGFLTGAVKPADEYSAYDMRSSARHGAGSGGALLPAAPGAGEGFDEFFPAQLRQAGDALLGGPLVQRRLAPLRQLTPAPAAGWGRCMGRSFGDAFLAAVFFAPFAAGRSSSKLPGSTMSALIVAFGRFGREGRSWS